MMTGRSAFLVAIVAVGLASMVLGILGFAGTQGPLLSNDSILPFVALVAGIALLAAAPMIRSGQGGDGTQARLEEEARALNNHALVMLSDKRAGIFYVNETLLNATGYRADEVLGQPTSLFYFEQDRATFESIRTGLNEGRSWSGEMRLRCKDGRAIWTMATILPRHDTSGKLVGVISIRTDITAAKIAAEHKDLFSMLDGLSDEVFMLDTDTLAFTYMNQAALAQTGWSKGDYRDRTLGDYHTTLDPEKLRDWLRPLVRGEVDQLVAYETIDGTRYDIRYSAIHRSDGVVRLVVLMRDDTANAQIDDAKSELLATISHELRTPLTSIKGSLGLLLSNAAGELPDKARGMLNIAHRNSDRLLNIVNDILDAQKSATGELTFDMKTAPLVDVLVEAVTANEPFADRFEVSVETRELLPSSIARYDFLRTLQVLTNLLSNAAKFSPPNGKIVVSMQETEAFTRISVRDFGSGIPKSVQPRIFQRFVQAPGQEGAKKGTGLGLNICQRIMQGQNGTISFDSKEGQGTTFMVDFPRVQQLVPEKLAAGAQSA